MIQYSNWKKEIAYSEQADLIWNNKGYMKLITSN